VIWTLILTHWRMAAWAGLAGALALALGLWRMEAARSAQLQTALTAARGEGAMAKAQAQATSDASAVVQAGAARDQQTQTQHVENDHAIQAAPGSGQGLDPGLNDAGRRGLCAYRAYRDTAPCVQLLGPDSGQRPDGGASDAPAGN
jgi:hypothetical protein